MFPLEYYKSIVAPVRPDYQVGQKVAIHLPFQRVASGVVLRIARLYMTVQYKEDPQNPRSSVKNEDFHRASGECRNDSRIWILFPEGNEFNDQLDAAKEKIKGRGIELHSSVERDDPQFVFYLADSLDDFYGPPEVKAIE